MHFYYPKTQEDALFKNGSKRPAFVIKPLKSVLNFEVERLSPQQLEYKIDRNDYPVNYNFYEIGYCGHHNFPYTNIQFKQSNNLILSHFQEEYHPFIHDTLRNKNTQLVTFFFNRPKKNASRTDIKNDHKNAYTFVLT